MEEKKSKKPIIIGVAVTLLVTLTLLGVTYAYYRTRIIGNQNDTSISVTSKTLELTYDDNNSRVAATGVEPGYSATKTFKVKNTGDETINEYMVYLEDFVNTFKRSEDWTYTLTCSSTSGNCSGTSGTLPVAEERIVTNTIVSGATHTYTLTVKYADSEEDQSEDMGAELTFRVNIRDYGSIQIFDDSDLLAYRIVDQALYANGLLGETVYREDPVTEVGKETTVNNSINLYYTNKTATIYSNQYITYADAVTYDENGYVGLLNPRIGKVADIYNILPGKYVLSAGSSTSSTISNNFNDIVYKVVSATTSTLVYDEYYVEWDKSVESSLSITEDDYGMSYYFRGNPDNNYLTFNNMCWRIVRIQGDGSIKIVLSDDEAGCSSATVDKVGSAFIGYSDWGYTGTNTANYNVDSTTSLKTGLNTFLNGGTFDSTSYSGFSDTAKSKLKTDEWCIGDENTASRLSSGSATLKCSGETVESQIGALTADEVTFAGGVLYKDNASTYLHQNADNVDSWWLISKYNSTNAFEVSWTGVLTYYDVDHDYHFVRPAVTLKEGTKVSGNGTLVSPYVVE